MEVTQEIHTGFFCAYLSVVLRQKKKKEKKERKLKGK